MHLLAFTSTIILLSSLTTVLSSVIAVDSSPGYGDLDDQFNITKPAANQYIHLTVPNTGNPPLTLDVIIYEPGERRPRKINKDVLAGLLNDAIADITHFNPEQASEHVSREGRTWRNILRLTKLVVDSTDGDGSWTWEEAGKCLSFFQGWVQEQPPGRIAEVGLGIGVSRGTPSVGDIAIMKGVREDDAGAVD